MSENSFGAKDTLAVGRAQLRDLSSRRAPAAFRRCAPAVLAEGAAGEPAAQRGRRHGHRGRHRGARQLGRRSRAEQGDRVHARRGCSCRTSPACPPSSTWPPCARRCGDLGGDPAKINPLVPGRAGDRPLGAGRRVRHAPTPSSATSSSSSSATASATRSCAGARARSTTSRWCRPDTGIVHQVNLEYLARVVVSPTRRRRRPTPTRCVGTDSHTTMVNGLGVLGWGVGGIEAEAAMLGQPMSMLIPQVRRLPAAPAQLPEGATATDLVLTVTEMLRKHGVVGKFVEFYGAGVAGAAAGRPRHHRQHVARVRLHLRDLPDRRRDARTTCGSPAARRSRSRWSRPTPRSRACGTTRALRAPRSPSTSSSTSATVVPRIAGPEAPAGPGRARPTPRRPSARRSAATSPTTTRATRPTRRASRRATPPRPAARRTATARARRRPGDGAARPPRAAPGARSPTAPRSELDHGAVVIAAITSCTNTSNPSVMVGAGAAGQKARRARPDAPSRGSRPRSRRARRSSPTTTTAPA